MRMCFSVDVEWAFVEAAFCSKGWGVLACARGFLSLYILCRSLRFSAASSADLAQASEALESSVANLRSEHSDASLSDYYALIAEPAVQAVLKTADSWGFNAFQLDLVTHQRPLSTLGMWLLQTSGLVQKHSKIF